MTWTAWKYNGVDFLADSDGGIIDSTGNWYGRWQDVAEFRKRQATRVYDKWPPQEGMAGRMSCRGVKA